MTVLDETWEEIKPATKFKLRGRQPEWITAIESDLTKFSRLLVVAPGGVGKSSVMGVLADRLWRNKGGKTLILENRDRLTEQTAQRIAVETGLDVEVEKADQRASPFCPIIVGSTQSMGRVNRLTGFADTHFQLVIPDECFPSTVKIDGIPINEIKPGDFVRTFNHETKKQEIRRVTGTSKTMALSLVEFNCSGRRIVSTASHPFFTKGGYKRAIDIIGSDEIAFDGDFLHKMWHESISINGIHKIQETEDPLRQMQKRRSGGDSDSQTRSMQTMREGSRVQRMQSLHEQSTSNHRESSLLQRRMQASVDERECPQGIWPENRRLQSEAFSRKNAQEQPNEQSCISGENEIINEGEDFSESRRERFFDRTSDGSINGARRSDYGVRDKYCGREGEISVASGVLQSGHRNSRCEISNRGGWEFTQNKEMEIPRSQENGGIEFVRVDSIKILERGSDERYSEVCPDGYVYNLEVEGNRNYFADGFLVHNCHFSLAPQPQRILNYFHFGAESLNENWVKPEHGLYIPKAAVVGFTASPDLGSKRSLGEYYQHQSVDYEYWQAVQDGWLVDIKEVNIPVKIDVRKIKVKQTAEGNNYDSTAQAQIIIPLIDDLAKQIVDNASDRKTICFMPNVDCSRRMADALSEMGLKAIFVSGDCIDKDEKTDEFQASGPGTVLVNCALYVYGIDFPDVSCIAPFSAILSKVNYIQKVYRGTRVLPGIVSDEMTAAERRMAIAISDKPFMLLLSPFFLSDRFDLCDRFDLYAQNAEVKKRLKVMGSVSPEAVEAATRDWLKSLKKAVKANEHKSSRTINPIAWALSLGDAKLASYEPQNDRDARPPTSGQLRLLGQFHVQIDKITCFGMADLVIGKIIYRDRLKMATPGMLDQLHLQGLSDQQAALLTQAEAASILDKLKADREEARLRSLLPSPSTPLPMAVEEEVC